MSLVLSQIIEELQRMRQVLPADAPVRAWLLSPAGGVPELAVLEICGVTGGVDRGTGRLGATLQLRLPQADVQAPALAAGPGRRDMVRAGGDHDGREDAEGPESPPVRRGCETPAPRGAAGAGLPGAASALIEHATLPPGMARPQNHAMPQGLAMPEKEAMPQCEVAPAMPQPPCHEIYPGPPGAETLGCPWW